MRAALYDGRGVGLAELPDPVAGPGQVVVRVSAAGLCHSDLTLMGRDPSVHPFPLPLVLGHEIAGVVEEVGPGVPSRRETQVGAPVVVHGPWGCGLCRACVDGRENHCPTARSEGVFPPGLGAPGGLADLVVVPDARHLVSADGLDAAQAAPLPDAGATSLHAVRSVQPALSPGSTAVVVGAGGLGHVALQLLNTLTAARVVAVDTSPAARALAAELGAHEVLDPAAADAADRVRALTRGQGAEVVLDFVASAATLPAARSMLTSGGRLVLVGVGTETLDVAVTTMPLGAVVHTPYWAARQDLVDVVALAREGRLQIRTREWPLSEVTAAYAALADGAVTGRPVVRPEASR